MASPLGHCGLPVIVTENNRHRALDEALASPSRTDFSA
jgi:hypothetical protein